MLLLLLAGCPMYDKERLEWVYTQLEDDDGDGFREIDGDCDDTNPDAHPGQYEVCNGFDDDCNGDADGDALDIQVWYQDRDGDGYGNDVLTRQSCTEVPTFANQGGDCDEEDATIHPEAETTCGEDIDRDCDGVRESVDQDRDGSPWCADCNDFDPSISPLLIERCNEQDDDCDGQIDEAGATLALWYPDVDGDGYGDEDAGVEACDRPASYYVLRGGDCEDLEEDVNPDAVEVCGDGMDNDCDGSPGACRMEGELEAAGSVVIDPTMEYSSSFYPFNIGDWNLDGADDVGISDQSTDPFGNITYKVEILVGPFDEVDIPAADRRQAWQRSSDPLNLPLYVDDPLGTGDGCAVVYVHPHGLSFLLPGSQGELTASNGIQTPSWGPDFPFTPSLQADPNGDGVQDLVGWEIRNEVLFGVSGLPLPMNMSTAPSLENFVSFNYPQELFLIAQAADVNGDGFDDISGISYDFTAGVVALAVFNGPMANTSLGDWDTLLTAGTNETFPSNLYDIDNDGTLDLWVVDAETEAYSTSIHEGAYTAETYRGFTMVAEDSFDQDGLVPSFGKPTGVDLDGDGAPDTIVSRRDFIDGTNTDVGKVYIEYGPILGSVDLSQTTTYVNGGLSSNPRIDERSLGTTTTFGDFTGTGGTSMVLGSHGYDFYREPATEYHYLYFFAHNW